MGVVTRKKGCTLLALLMLASTATLSQSLRPFESPQYLCINSHMRIGVGYQFADLGSASLGPTLDATTTETLVLSHLYTNQLRFQLTYLV